jgi:hypothetical protein
MHELGHNLGLHHGGPKTNDVVIDWGYAYKPNFFSVMSYNYQLIGLTVDGVSGVLDFSRVAVSGVNEQALREDLGFAPVSPTSESDLEDYGVFVRGKQWIHTTHGASAKLDFNDNGNIETVSLNPTIHNTDLNHDGDKTDYYWPCVIDWLHLKFGGGQIGEGFKMLSSPESIECTTGE